MLIHYKIKIFIIILIIGFSIISCNNYCDNSGKTGVCYICLGTGKIGDRDCNNCKGTGNCPCTERIPPAFSIHFR